MTFLTTLIVFFATFALVQGTQTSTTASSDITSFIIASPTPSPSTTASSLATSSITLARASSITHTINVWVLELTPGITNSYTVISSPLTTNSTTYVTMTSIANNHTTATKRVTLRPPPAIIEIADGPAKVTSKSETNEIQESFFESISVGVALIATFVLVVSVMLLYSY